MIIINADDFGKNKRATDNIYRCHQRCKITTTGAMVFMKDSERSAEIAYSGDMDVGLHLNFTQNFDGKIINSQKLKEYHNQIRQYLNKSKYNSILYNPLLINQFDYVYKYQVEEFYNLFKKEPAHINGHHHMHLCTNMLMHKIIPGNKYVRTTFTFKRRQRNAMNRLYRKFISLYVERNYISTNNFYSLKAIIDDYHNRADRLHEIIYLSKNHSIEISVHPEKFDEFRYLMSGEFSAFLDKVKIGKYTDLS